MTGNLLKGYRGDECKNMSYGICVKIDNARIERNRKFFFFFFIFNIFFLFSFSFIRLMKMHEYSLLKTVKEIK